MNNKIAVGMSGGVDSCVAAYLLKKKGWDVVGFTLKFYSYENRCCDLDSLSQAQRLCHKLKIPHYVLDVRDMFKEKIINYFIESYLKGFTPNPCVYCNCYVKFGIFLEKIKSFGIDKLATGHYVSLIKDGDLNYFKVNKDKIKSQEYFLTLIKPEVLKYLIFPLSDYNKTQVKEIAKNERIMFMVRKESQDVCFVKDKSYPKFIEENVPDYSKYFGEIKYIDGNVLGKHKGIYNYTYGQRGGLGVSWKTPLYVTNIDSETNSIIVGEKDSLLRNKFYVNGLNWFLPPEKYKNIKVRIRYNSFLIGCGLQFMGDRVLVTLDEKTDKLSPGQIAAFYYKDILLGGGVIEKE